MPFKIKNKKRKISSLKSQVKEIQKFKKEYKRIVEDIEGKNAFEFQYWFDRRDKLPTKLNKLHIRNLKLIKEKGKTISPKELRGNEGFKFTNEKRNEVKNKLKETIKTFNSKIEEKLYLIAKERKRLKIKKYFILIISMLLWVFFVLLLLVLL